MAGNTITIKNENTPALAGLNFTLAEFYKPAKQEFQLYACIPLALQIFRTYFSKLYGKDVQWKISSTYRPNDSLSMPEAHRIPPPAVDSVPYDESLRVEILGHIRNELKRWENSQLIKDVLATGLNIIIIENTCLHIHYRTYNLHYPKNYSSGIYLGEWGIKDNKQYNIAYSYNSPLKT